MIRDTVPLLRISKKLIWLFLAAWVIPTLACNWPVAHQKPQEIDLKALRQTMEAQLQAAATETPIPAEDGTPAPQLATPNSENLAVFPTPGVLPTLPANSEVQYNYLTQPGDTLAALAKRFKVEPAQIISSAVLPENRYLPPGVLVWIPFTSTITTETTAIFPDSEVIYSPTSLDFDAASFIFSAGGYLSTHHENVNGEILSGAEIVTRVAQESSVNPRLLLAFLEHRSGWVFGKPDDLKNLDYPIGFRVSNRRGLYQELVMAATHLNIGYYGWRAGDFTNIKYSDGSSQAVNPWLNPGSAAVQNLFAKFYPPKKWTEALYGPGNFPDVYTDLFGSPWERAAQNEPFLTPDLVQPDLELPFSSGERWSLTGGPHASWNTGSPRGAIDFAPVTGEPACTISRAWVTASAAGVVSRAVNNVVAIDLDGDGNEGTGWVVVYLHIAAEDRVQFGQQVSVNDRLGHPSCERGQSTGTHVHIARKYNGEWLPADYPAPMVLSGWQVQAGEKNYQGNLIKADKIVTASPVGPRTSIVVR